MKKVTAEPYREIDFSTARRGAVIPLEAGKSKISIRLDSAVIEYFRRQAAPPISAALDSALSFSKLP